MKANKTRLDLDWGVNPSWNKKKIDDHFRNIAKKHHLRMKVLAYDGPGGGCPAIQFVGSKYDLERLVVEDYCKVDSIDTAMKNLGWKDFDEFIAGNPHEYDLTDADKEYISIASLKNDEFFDLSNDDNTYDFIRETGENDPMHHHTGACNVKAWRRLKACKNLKTVSNATAIAWWILTYSWLSIDKNVAKLLKNFAYNPYATSITILDKDGNKISYEKLKSNEHSSKDGLPNR